MLPASLRRNWRRPIVLVPALSVAALAAAVPSTYVLTNTALAVTGPANGALVGAAAAGDITFRVVPSGGSPRDVTLALDGKAARAQVSGDAAILQLRGLPNGRHTLTARTDGSLPAEHSTVTRTFTIDTTPPVLRLTIPKAGSRHSPVTLTGTAAGATAVTVAGKPVALHDGKFSVRFATAPAGVALVARDAAGNQTSQTVDVPVRYPDGIRAVHETGLSWTFDRDRNEALALVRAHKINAIELDIKDEDGAVNFDPHVALAAQIGAVHHYYDAAKVSRQLHRMGVRLLGRIVTFKDPRLASWAWKHGHQDWVVQTPDGQPWGSSSGYGAASFTNFADETVHQYNLDVAKAAAKAGFDDIIFDYIRRPDGPFGQMRVVGMAHTTQAAYAAINNFSEEARSALRPLGAFVGAALFAQAAAIPQDTAQNVPDMAKYLDVVTPMDYPSHWLHGEYDVPNPNAGPQATHDVVYRSLKSWTKAVKGTNADVVPWLQCEDWGGPYSPEMVASQIQASRQNSMPGFILWNANAYYAKWASALTPDAPDVLS